MEAKDEFPQTALAAAGRRRRLPSRWTGDRVTSVFTLALAFPLAAALYERGDSLLPLLAGALVVAVGWTLLFTRLRGRVMNWHAVPTAIIFSLLVPPSAPLWHALLALSFGVVVGEQIFGGRGYSFLHPAVAALAFLFCSAVFQIADGVQAVGAGMLRGLQDTRVPMIYAALGYWGFGMPLSLFFAFWMKLEGLGIWIGLAAGLAAVACMMLWRWINRERLGLLVVH